MKKSILVLSASVLSLMSCNKNNSGNKAVLEQDTSSTEVVDHNGKIDSATDASHEVAVDDKVVDREESFLYSGLDKSKAKIIFTDKGKDHTITIQSNNKTFILDKKDSKDGTVTYERSGIKAEVKGDSLFIIQGETVIPLKKMNI